jgi:hypothetical protein
MVLISKRFLVQSSRDPNMTSAIEVDDRTIETIHRGEETVTGKTVIKVSPDVKTRTMSTTNAGANSGQASVRVFEKR